MTASAINLQLQEIYQPYLDRLYSQDWSVSTSAPLLMHVFDEYMTAPRKIMFVGQETHNWGGTIDSKPSLQNLLQVYRGFEFGKHYSKNGKKPRILTSPFWNFIRSSFHRLNAHDPVINRHTNGFLWTNISKFDQGGTTPSRESQTQNAKGFELLKQEIAITNPDVVVFLTGRKYDDRINAVFNTESRELRTDGLLYSLTTTDGSLPALTFKTEHPRTLNKMKMYYTVLDELVRLASQ